MSIPAERLTEGSQILVHGKISFSRLASLVDGAALQRSIEDARKRGVLYPTLKPHTTINLVDASVVPANPAALTIEEQYVQEKLYQVKSGDNAGKIGFSLDNVSNYLPTILEPDPTVPGANGAPGAYRQLVLPRDLASGLEVTLVINVFKPQGFEKRGLGLQQVVLHEEPRYYASAGGVDTNALAARGIVISGPINPVAAADAPTAGTDTAAAAAAFASEAERSGFSAPANTGIDASGYAVPTPGAQGTAPVAVQQFPVSQPIAAAPAVAAPVAVAPAAPVAAPVVETPEQTIARLQQQIAEQKAAQAASGGGSAFDAVPVATPAGQASPWDLPGSSPASYVG